MNDRNDEVNELWKMADYISYYDSTHSTAEELVAYYEDNVDMPEWYDNHDRQLLIDRVRGYISQSPTQ